MLEYQMDDMLEKYLNEAYKENAQLFKNTMNALNTLNYNLYVPGKSFSCIFFLDKLEYRLQEIIDTSESSEDAITKLDGYLSYAIRSYFNKAHGVILDKDTPLLILEEFILSLSSIYNQDLINLENLLVSIENDTVGDNIERSTELLKEFMTVPEPDIYDAIESVSDRFFKILKKFIKYKLRNPDIHTSEDDIKVLEPLIAIDNNFSTTRMAKSILYAGFKEFKFEQTLDIMFNFINSHHGDIEAIAYEIAAFNILSKDKPIINVSTFKEYIKQDALGLSDADIDKYGEYIIPKVLELSRSIK